MIMVIYLCCDVLVRLGVGDGSWVMKLEIKCVLFFILLVSGEVGLLFVCMLLFLLLLDCSFWFLLFII